MAEAKKIKVVQTGSPIGRTEDQRATLKGLGLNKRHRSRVLEDTPAVRGMIAKVQLKNGTIQHKVVGEHGASRVLMAPAKAGDGIIAGGPMRAVFETLGIKDIVAKSVGTSNPHNMIKATFVALEKLNSPRMVATRRGKKVGDLLGRRDGTQAEATAEASA